MDQNDSRKGPLKGVRSEEIEQALAVIDSLEAVSETDPTDDDVAVIVDKPFSEDSAASHSATERGSAAPSADALDDTVELALPPLSPPPVMETPFDWRRPLPPAQATGSVLLADLEPQTTPAELAQVVLAKLEADLGPAEPGRLSPKAGSDHDPAEPPDLTEFAVMEGDGAEPPDLTEFAVMEGDGAEPPDLTEFAVMEGDGAEPREEIVLQPNDVEFIDGGTAEIDVIEGS